MEKKVFSRFISIVALLVLFLGIIEPSLNCVYAYTKESYKKDNEMDRDGNSLRWYRENSITVSPAENPKLFKCSKDNNTYEVDIANIPLDGNIYRFVDSRTGREVFYKVISYKALNKKSKVYRIEVQRAIYDGSNFIIDSKPIVFEETKSYQNIYFKFFRKGKYSDKFTPTPKDQGGVVPEAPITEIEEPEEAVPETPTKEIKEIKEIEEVVPKKPITETKEQEEVVPEKPITEVKEPEKVVPETPITEPEKAVPQDVSKIIVTRLSGSTRIETALAIADEFRGNSKLNSVILTSANNFPDALAGAQLTSKYSAPILLVNKTAGKSLATLNYIVKNVNKTGEIIVLGSAGIIDNSIVKYLNGSGFNNIKRLGGANRFKTNVDIVKDINPAKGSDVIISSAVNFPDALSISSISSINGIPTILSNKDRLSNEVKSLLQSIKPNKIYISGGVGAISSHVEEELKTYSTQVIRIGGTNRYETSVNINNYFKSNLSGGSVILTSGLNFPDGLAGISLALKYNAPILLVDHRNPDIQKQFISDNNIKNIYVLGSTSVVSRGLINYFIE